MAHNPSVHGCRSGRPDCFVVGCWEGVEASPAFGFGAGRRFLQLPPSSLRVFGRLVTSADRTRTAHEHGRDHTRGGTAHHAPFGLADGRRRRIRPRTHASSSQEHRSAEPLRPLPAMSVPFHGVPASHMRRYSEI